MEDHDTEAADSDIASTERKARAMNVVLNQFSNFYSVWGPHQ